MLDVQQRAARARVVVSVVQSAVDPGGGGATEAAFDTDKWLVGEEQKTTPHLLYWGPRERRCWMWKSAPKPTKVPFLPPLHRRKNSPALPLLTPSSPPPTCQPPFNSHTPAPTS